MPDSIPACFRGGVGAPPPPSAACPSLATSVYDTRLGQAALSWSRSLLGLSLRCILRLSAINDSSEEEEEQLLSFRIRPWLFWKRRGSKHLRLQDRDVHVTWDLNKARFSAGPEPMSGYFVAVAVDGELALVAGDLLDQAYKATKSQKPICISGLKPSILVSRREHVEMSECYKSKVRAFGKEREISINLVGKERERGEVGLWIAVDGKRVLHVKRLKWKFRGSEKVEIEASNSGNNNNSTDKIQISWDLHNWLFPSRDKSSNNPSIPVDTDADAIFVFRFEKEGAWEDDEGASFGGYFGNFGNNLGNWSESSSNGGGGKRRGGRRGQRGNLRKTGSASSSASSSMSWASGSSVMDWASVEEFELRKAEGFSLLVYAWKS